MKGYKKTSETIWKGRTSDTTAYLHEKVIFINLATESLALRSQKAFGLVGYSCDTGVHRNQGRIGAAEGPTHIRQALAKLPNHLKPSSQLLDIGTIQCEDGDMETAQLLLSKQVTNLLSNNIFPLVVGGGHDIAYGHFKGIDTFLNVKKQNTTLGIINFDAHFDLRNLKGQGNSGTPFFQIASDCKKEQKKFNYLCLGIREDANTEDLFKTANALGVHYITNEAFQMYRWNAIQKEIQQFTSQVDHLYITIDLDGFSSAYAPGVSAASPMGFAPNMVLASLQEIIKTKKVLSLDIAEMNPNYDIDGQTAKLAASLLHFTMHKTDLL